ncbi:MAG: hypothetical protein DHS20C21_11740 [Gemmatimonadota bacterium]|nr:MAG: hypothetical protein DHS20C21_11740 [Gemmatimonadota bacterium]
MPGRDKTVLILGGAGLVGTQCAKRIAREHAVERIVLASLFRKETQESVVALQDRFPTIEFDGYYGNLFVRGEPTPISESVEEISPREFAEDEEHRQAIFDDLFLDFETAYRGSRLARLIAREQPDVVVDTVNTATGISYQDLFSSSFVVSRGLEEAKTDGVSSGFNADVQKHLISASVPQLILHVRLLHRAMTEAKTRIYVKVGTTGTGGMGLNIPYTHGEDKPSPTLMSKTATAFAHTGLLFLMARTPDCPIIKEIKPAAMIGYRNIGFEQVRGPQFRPVPNGSGNGERVHMVTGEPLDLYEAAQQRLGKTLDNEPDFDGFTPLQASDGTPERLTIPCVNTGENGIFTRGEFEAITALGQMEFVTPEEIAQLVTLEIQGNNTGRDVISGLDSSILSPSYKGGLIREVAIDELQKLEDEKGVPSVAIGQLGPPQLAKYLYEAYFLRHLYGTVDNVIADEAGNQRSAEDVSAEMLAAVSVSPLRHTIASIGIPILFPDGRTILRGPVIKIPAYNKKAHIMELTDESIDAYARKGWVDLRPAHMGWWLERFRKMRSSVFRRGSKWSSERLDIRSYLFEEIRIGQVVAWIFNNEIEPRGHRIK